MREKSLRLYKIDINYIKYLYSFDNRVQFNPNNDDDYSAKRPYLGVILDINNFDIYFMFIFWRGHKNLYAASRTNS